MKKTKIFTGFLYLFLFFSLMSFAAAQSQVVDLDNLRNVATPLHIVELILALFIAYASLKFFRITRPINLFLFIYTAIGFFIINSLLYLFLYLSMNSSLQISFISVYIMGRIALMGMLVSFVVFFYQWNKVMRKTN